MFKTKGCAGMPEPDEDWRTSPHLAEDWTKRHTHWSRERNRYVVQPFKDSIQRFKPIEPTIGPGTYKIPADNITNKGSTVVTSSFLSTSAQNADFNHQHNPEAGDYDPRWEKAGRNSPMREGGIKIL